MKETVRDVHFLQDESFFAAAQKQKVFIYDRNGVEVHCLRHHRDVNRLDYLRHHFLLCSVGDKGILEYSDVTCGKIVGEIRTKLGKCDTLSSNPSTGIVCLGHHCGLTTMWSPLVSHPLASIHAHRGAVQTVACSPDGRYLATFGRADDRLKIWDLRMFKSLSESVFPRHGVVESISFSQQNLLAVAFGRRVEVFRDVGAASRLSVYMTHSIDDVAADDREHRLRGSLSIGSLKFCPYEDFLGVGHTFGFSSLLIPGSGEANFDTFVANPFESRRQRQEREVHELLDKLPPETIALDPSFIGKVDDRSEWSKRKEEEEAEAEAQGGEREWNEGEGDDEKEKSATSTSGKTLPLRNRRRRASLHRSIETKKERVRSSKRAVIEGRKKRESGVAAPDESSAPQRKKRIRPVLDRFAVRTFDKKKKKR